MKEIELSTIVPVEALQLDVFEQNALVRTRHQQHRWSNAWNTILNIGLYQTGPEVSEVGSTWVENLNDMHALRPFSSMDLHELGGEISFVSHAWSQEITTPSEAATPRRVVSIPWTLDTRLICYRRDLLARAGVDEAMAFITPEAMYTTLLRLQASGIRYPLGMVTGGLSLHYLACWVWGRGGHFRSRDYRRIALVEPQARQGMIDFFQLHHFIDPTRQGADQRATMSQYYQGQTAVMVTGQWVMKPIKDRQEDILPEVVENTRYARIPGVPFVGSSHLVIWRHTLFEQDCLKLISHLVSPEVLPRVFHFSGNFPARAQLLNAPPFSTDPDYRMAVDCIRKGRMVRSSRLWGGVEARVNMMCSQLWKDLFEDPQLDLPAEIDRRVSELAERLEKTLLANL